MACLTFLAPARRAACAALVTVALAGTVDVAGASARSEYERFLARVEAMRLDGPRPTPRPQMRRAIAEGEAIARRHARTGYADNALWQAATVALAAYHVYRLPVDRTRGIALLKDLVERYPSSSLVGDARALLRKHAPPATARASRKPEPPRRKPQPSPAPAEVAMTPASVVDAPDDDVPSPVPPAPAPSAPISSAALVSSAAPMATAAPVALEAARTAAVPPAPRKARPAARAAGRMTVLRGVRRTQIGDTIRLTLDFDGEVDFDQQRLPGPERVFFDFAQTAPIAALTDTVLHFEGPTVRRVRLGRPKPGVTRLAIDLDGVARYSVFALYHPFRLTIDLEPVSARPARTPLRAAAPAPTAGPTSAAAAEDTTASLPPEVSAAPAPPPLLPANRVAAATTAPPLTPPARLVVVEPLLAADNPLAATARLRRSVAAAPALATRVVARPAPLLRLRRTHPLMVRAAVRPPNGLPPGLDLAAFVVPANRSARAGRPAGTASDDAAEAAAGSAGPDVAAAPVAPLPLIPAAPAENGSGGFSIARQLGLGVSRIVIDPGHGGKDPGAPGKKTTEAEIVLDVALRVEKLLAAEAGIEVVLTRRTDVFIPLEERTAIANRQKADLFLSIHANSSRNRKAAGVETYVLNFATTADAASVAARENASAAGSMRNLPDMVRAITQGNKRDESRELASAIQASMVSQLRPHNAGLRDLGVKQAPFVVLIGAGMPSVLAEIAFISHAREGGLLKTEKYRQRIAEALAAAVVRYTRTLKPVGTVASQN